MGIIYSFLRHLSRKLSWSRAARAQTRCCNVEYRAPLLIFLFTSETVRFAILSLCIHCCLLILCHASTFRLFPVLAMLSSGGMALVAAVCCQEWTTGMQVPRILSFSPQARTTHSRSFELLEQNASDWATHRQMGFISHSFETGQTKVKVPVDLVSSGSSPCANTACALTQWKRPLPFMGAPNAMPRPPLHSRTTTPPRSVSAYGFQWDTESQATVPTTTDSFWSYKFHLLPSFANI